MYISQNNLAGVLEGIWDSTNLSGIPLDLANLNYQKVLDDIIEQGNDCWEGSVPATVQTPADAKLFAQQLKAYKVALARVAQYQLSVGTPLISQTNVIGEGWDEGILETYDIIKTIITPAILALETTVEQISTDRDGISTTTTVANPLIVKDDEERAAAQATIDATPSAVIEAYNAL